MNNGTCTVKMLSRSTNIDMKKIKIKATEARPHVQPNKKKFDHEYRHGNVKPKRA